VRGDQQKNRASALLKSPKRPHVEGKKKEAERGRGGDLPDWGADKRNRCPRDLGMVENRKKTTTGRGRKGKRRDSAGSSFTAPRERPERKTSRQGRSLGPRGLTMAYSTLSGGERAVA